MTDFSNISAELIRFGHEKPDLVNIADGIRREVFVNEQGVPYEIEHDEFEPTSQHYLLYLDGCPMATARWRLTIHGIKLERFAVLEKYRNRVWGTLLLKEVLKDLLPLKRPLYLHAQVRAMNYYSRMGFLAEGPEFEEAGIMHYKMVMNPCA